MTDPITPRAVLELMGHEALVLEAYLDSERVWTWAMGITAAAGVNVLAYKDKPQPLAVCIAASVNVLRARYLPAVVKAFAGRQLTEAQLAAALSFHYNTGGIARADWVKSFMLGKPAQAKREFMNWSSPASIIERREKERDLFFGGVWTQTGKVSVYPVSKPSYQPNLRGGKQVDITAAVAAALAPAT